MQTKRVLAGVLTSTLLLGACPAALAADYNDSSLTGGSAWSEWSATALCSRKAISWGGRLPRRTGTIWRPIWAAEKHLSILNL